MLLFRRKDNLKVHIKRLHSGIRQQQLQELQEPQEQQQQQSRKRRRSSANLTADDSASEAGRSHIVGHINQVPTKADSHIINIILPLMICTNSIYCLLQDGSIMPVASSSSASTSTASAADQ